MKEGKIKTILMDCDGVLVDSEVVYLTSLVNYLKTLGVDTTVEEMICLVGSDIESITEKIQNEFGLAHYSASELIKGQREQFAKEFSPEMLQECPA